MYQKQHGRPNIGAMADDGAPSTACTGSSLLQPLSELTDLPLDQVRAAGARTSTPDPGGRRSGGRRRGDKERRGRGREGVFVNFVACQLCALISAFWFRLFLHPSKTSPVIRHAVATLLGLYFAMFCFGWYALHFLVQSGLAYGIMILTGVEHMHKYCLVVALTYLSLCQITRVYVFDYGMYTADFTG
ncbi:unnamed protein product [Oreochromis niloticus]|nr:unnamed protein product [Mustela putorius furo]